MVSVREREIYPNAPIVLMAIEVRHSPCEQIERAQLARLSQSLGGLLPLPGEVSEISFTVHTDPSGPPVHQQAITTVPRWTSRDKRTALTVRPDSLVIETTDYGSYDRVRGLLEIALESRVAIATPAGVERIGLRYIDEIRVPSKIEGAIPSWQEWVDKSLLGPTHIDENLNLSSAGHEGLVVFSSDNNRALVLRYGAQSEYAVQSTPELRRPLPPPGPLFKLDIDSFWQSGEVIPEFDSDFILEQADALHVPVRGVFESLITDRLRAEVLRDG